MSSGAEILMLGTGHASVSRCYNTCFILSRGDDSLLVDAGGGNGIIRQFEQAGRRFSDLSALFVTHAHTDHILGMVWVLRMLCVHIFSYPDFSIPVYGNAKCIEVLRWLCRNTLSAKYNAAIDAGIRFVEVHDGDCVTVGRSLPVRFFDMLTPNEPQMGFEAQIAPDFRLVCLGDEPYRPHLADTVSGTDILLCEAYCLADEADRFHPHQKWHGTVSEAAATAQALGVKRLLLYHTEDSDLPNRRDRYTAEASRHFSGRILIPADLETVTLCRNS